MKNDLINLIKDAGKEILKFHGNKDFLIKEDASPLTWADQASHQYLSKNLINIKNIPILSEENEIPFDIRKEWQEFWLIDPLDGTKEFINGYDDFCINVALIQGNKPVIGLIYAPKLKELYWAESGKGFEYYGQAQEHLKVLGIIGAVSRFHNSSATKHFMEINKINTHTIGAAIKFGRMALGLIDLYPRFAGSKEWDIAAGHIILKEAKCNIMDLVTKKEPIYNKPTLINNYFIASGSNFDINNFQYLGLI